MAGTETTQTMPPIVTAAVVGTSKARDAHAATGTPVDALIPDLDPERALLLRAGAWAIYRQAGQLAAPAIPAVAPPPPETLPVCPPAAAALIEMLFSGEHSDLLPEALDRLHQAGLRLSVTLLPRALSHTDAQVRSKLQPVLGARGYWLARFNPRWTWAEEALAEGELPANAETIWQEGTRAQRVEILRRLRAVDPAQACAWLEGVWKREKVDQRAELLATLDVGLSADDEPLLERTLDDRAERVRAIAASLLERIPTSEYARRMRERAAALLVFTRGKLDAKPPTTFDKSWLRDGLTEKPPSGIGERAWWLLQALQRVPPSHWEQRFSLAPESLIAATEGAKWRMQIAEGWTDAMEGYGERSWAVSLWRFWRAATDKEIKQARGSRENRLEQVVPFLPAEEREAWALARLADPEMKGEPDLDELLALLPRPWSEAVGNAFIQGLRAFTAALTPKSQTGEPWEDALDTAARALLPTCFAAALEPFPLPEMPEGKRPNVPYLRTWLDMFAETIRLRARIREEIPL